jgi:putative ABC transport system permease protein
MIGSIFRFFLRRRKMENELDAELRHHLDHLTEQHVAQGMSPLEARREAVLLLGGVEAVKDQCRDARRGRLVESFLQDVRYGIRAMLKNPGFAAAAVITLALGIGANTAIFSLVYGVLLRPLPYAQGGQLVVLHQNVPKARVFDFPFSVKELAEYRDGNRTLADVVEHHSMPFLLMDRNSAQRVDVAVVSANFFDVLGVRPLLGRTFVAADDVHDAAAVLILSYKYWQTHEGGNPDMVGKVFQMNRKPHTVIGVLPPIPQYPQESDAYVTTVQCPYRSSDRFIANRRLRMMTAFARVKPGVSVDQAQADLSVVAARIADANPALYLKDDGYSLTVSRLRDDLTRRARGMFLVLLGVAGFVLLIACANVANLLLARLLTLERELAVRAALGASQGRLLRQVVTESVVLSVAGGLLGLALAPAALAGLVKFAAGFTARASEVRLDAPVLLFTFVISVVTGIAFGLLPALFSGHRLGTSFPQTAGWSTPDRRRQRLRAFLVIAQVAVSVVLLAGAGLMLRSFARMHRVYPGFAPERLLTMRLSTPNPPYTMDNLRALENEAIAKLKSVGGVEQAAASSSFPFNHAGVVRGPGAIQFEIDGRLRGQGEATQTFDLRVVSPEYFDTLRQPIVEGRTFTAHDEDGPPVVIVSQAMARHRFPIEDPIGKRIRFDAGMGFGDWNEIVGVAGDVREFGLNRAPADEVYAVNRSGFSGRLIVRTKVDPQAMTAGIRAAIHEIHPLIAIDQVDTIEHAEYESMASPRVMTTLLGLFAGLAALISAGGIAAVMALSVSRRRREIGVRMALGARSGAIVSMVLRQGVALAAVGTAVGIGGAAGLTRLLSAFLYGTSPTDAVTFVAVPLLFLLVAGIASYLPAREVTTIDPLDALRQE